MNILAITFFYNPQVEKAIANVERYIDNVSRLIVWNNTPNTDADFCKQLFVGKPYEAKLIYAGGKGNMGLSKPINFAMSITINEGYDGLLTMDQDSSWKNFEHYVDTIAELDYLHNAFEPRINGGSDGVSVEQVAFDMIVNSGMFYGRGCINSVGFMNEKFVVEGCDTEYGARICLCQEVKLYRINEAILLHNIEDQQVIPPPHTQRICTYILLCLLRSFLKFSGRT